MKQQGIRVYGIRQAVFFLLISLYLIPYTSTAQHFKAGLLAGIATTQVDGDTYAGYDKAGLFAGASVSSRFSKAPKWSVSFEITYIQKGSRKVPHPDKGDFADYKLKLDYAEVPLLLKYDFNLSDSTGQSHSSFTLFGGLAIGALVHSKEWDAFGVLPQGVPFQKTDLSTILGLSYSVSEHVGFDARTEYSVFPVRKGGNISYYQNWTYKFFKPGYYNNLIVFSLHYRF
jgi:hypothetical protein